MRMMYQMLELLDPLAVATPPQDGCYITGLFLEGARWHKKKKTLLESRMKELYTRMPVLWLKPTKDRPPPTNNVYYCPVRQRKRACA